MIDAVTLTSNFDVVSVLGAGIAAVDGAGGVALPACWAFACGRRVLAIAMASAPVAVRRANLRTSPRVRSSLLILSGTLGSFISISAKRLARLKPRMALTYVSVRESDSYPDILHHPAEPKIG